MDPYAFLDALFGGGGGATSSVQGSPSLNQGFAPVSGWMIGQSFASAGPVGQYLGAIYGSPGTGIPSHEWVRQQEARAAGHGSSGGVGHTTSYADDDGSDGRRGHFSGGSSGASGERPETLSRYSESGRASSTDDGVPTVRVFGTPREVPKSRDSSDAYLFQPSFPVGRENEIRFDPPLPRQKGPVRRVTPAPLPPLPHPDRPELGPLPSNSFTDPDSGRFTVPNPVRAESPWATDAATPNQLLQWGSWERPEAAPLPRPERGFTRPIETAPTVPVGHSADRSFWSRGGTGLATGLFTASVGVAAVMWWNPVGWVAGVTAVLAIAGGVAAASASAVELSASYAGATTPEQDERMDQAVSAALGFSSIGGIGGGLGGMFYADDPERGFETGSTFGGFIEGAGGIAIGLPRLVRAMPRIWRVIAPYGRGLILGPAFGHGATAGIGGFGVRIPRPNWPIRTPTAQRVKNVEFLEHTPLIERNEDWARYQVQATGSRNEGVFQINYLNGDTQIVLADRYMRRPHTILEAKFGDMGQMFDPIREEHIIKQVGNYIDITNVRGGRVGYLVSTERGAMRLSQRFSSQFEAEFRSGQLWVDWVPWIKP